MREKALANEADKRRRQDALAKEQCCHEANERHLQDALANKQHCHEAAARNAASVELLPAKERRCRELAECAAAMAENTLAAEQCRRESAECAVVTAENALAEEQHRQESAERAAATAEKALADEVDEGHCQEEATHAAALADMALAKERCCHEMATTTAMVAEKAIAQLTATLAEMVLTAHEKALADKTNKQRRAAVLEKVLADDANEQCRAAAQEKALADEANEQRRAAAQDKALANEANNQRCHESAKCATTLATKAEHNEDDNNVARQLEAYAAPFFACVDVVMAKIRAMDDGFDNWAAFGDKILAKEDNKASDLTMPPSAPPTAVLPTLHRPTTYKDMVLSTMGGSLCTKSLFSCLLTTVDDQPQTACRCS